MINRRPVHRSVHRSLLLAAALTIVSGCGDRCERTDTGELYRICDLADLPCPHRYRPATITWPSG